MFRSPFVTTYGFSNGRQLTSALIYVRFSSQFKQIQKMLPLFYVAIVLGVLVLIKYSLWRDNFSRQFPGNKPGFFNVLGDSAIVLMHCLSNTDLPLLYSLGLFMKERAEQFQQLFCLWIFYQPSFFMVKAEAVKQLLSKGSLEKNWAYGYLEPLLGTGLVTSSVEKWKPRRKLLTPCFHADILRGFLTVHNIRNNAWDFNRSSRKNSAYYINSMKRISDIYLSRMLKIWEYSDFIFNLTSGREGKRLIKMIEDFTKS
ncbi:cytochrome P450 4V2, partial [Trichonephila inaurata madagascariensis]